MRPCSAAPRTGSSKRGLRRRPASAARRTDDSSACVHTAPVSRAPPKCHSCSSAPCQLAVRQVRHAPIKAVREFIRRSARPSGAVVRRASAARWRMAEPWGDTAGAAAWAAGVAAALEAGAHGLLPGRVEPAAVAAAAAAAATATAAAGGSLAPWVDSLTPTELGALVSQWQGAPPSLPRPPAASQRWRCLDRAHGHGCSRCVARRRACF